ncbi:MAG: TPM domain-containing protein [Paracoccaceae bacterium]
MFAPDQDLETFSAGLFDQWGIGDATRNDGILFLILRTDREARIELGKGYAGEWQFEANSVMQNGVIPEFKKEDYVAGIRAGVTGTIEKIARPFHAGAEPPEPKGGVSGWWAALIFAPLLLVGLVRRLKARLARCPQCGARGITTESRTLQAATRTQTGQGERVTDCPSCGYHGVVPFTIPMRSDRDKSSSGSSFGGGSSGGGGASGKW